MSRSKLREAHIPILLWLPAAAMLHLGGGTGASEMAVNVAERASILRFSRGVRSQVAASVDGSSGPSEIEILDEAPPLPPTEASPGVPDEASSPSEVEPGPLPVPTAQPTAEPKAAEVPAPPKPEPEPEKKAAPPTPPGEAPKPPPKLEAPAAPLPPAPPLAPVLPNGRIAVQNDPTLDPNQQDNPNASRIADNANTTEEERQAALRSYDQNAPKPTGGGSPHEGPEQKPGNADTDERGHSVATKGDGAPHPGLEHGPDHETSPTARSPLSPESRIGRVATPSEKAQAPSLGGQGERMPEAVSSERGTYSLDPDGGDGRVRGEARALRSGRKGLGALEGLILPGHLPTRFSVNAYGLQDALGAKQLRAEAEVARNTRLNKHRGTMRGLDFQKYRAAIENYVPQVKEGNQTSLNAARVPFASYINSMHNRIHPIFAEGFLASLDASPDPRLANLELVTHVEIILDGATGKLVNAGIVRPSGVTALEVAALRAIEEASPYGKAPDVILSPDGRVYLHWEFYRNPYFACTSQFAHPYMLKDAPAREREPVPTPPLPPPRLRGDPPKFGLR